MEAAGKMTLSEQFYSLAAQLCIESGAFNAGIQDATDPF
jgi:hypothetical protein